MEIHKQQIALQYQLNKSLEDKKRSLRLLSLDGGGIRGLVLIQILMELEELNEAFNENFVLKNFDWIAGTSTGAILALALANGFSPIKCLRLYLRLKDDIFSRWPYSEEKFEEFLKANLGENRKMANINKKLKVFVTATKADQIPIKLILFRSYDSPFKESAEFLPQNANIWKAARCSSAAPTYFKSVNGIMDGGLMANNPGVTLLLEVFKHIDIQALSGGNEKIELPELAFMLSLGTGKCPEVPISITDVSLQWGVQGLIQTMTALANLKSILVEQLSTSDGQVVELARYMSHTRRAPYFRFTPELNNDVQLDTVDNNLLVEMLWTTKEYIREKCSIDVVSLSHKRLQKCNRE
ncbi:hypothetical protein Mgra_00003923 [Meloidogyne graminicola]|uniref:PNPLA domain-containing protein n=1 Tax=Meloidogyne graminicola TaxID=189291 RepID=A0A8S9ZUR8_9BILA|nr:hypothetical protein Mgra_00003923 [Meloidogyne graminicola]